MGATQTEMLVSKHKLPNKQEVDRICRSAEAHFIICSSAQLYICDDNRGANEYDFKKALDLLEYISEVTLSSYGASTSR